MENLLIINKNSQGFVDIVEKVKSESGLNIYECNNFKDAVKITENDTPDCIFIIVYLIEEGDLKLFKSIKNHKNTKMTPVILIGESIDRQTGRRIDTLLTLGIYDVLINPSYDGLMRKAKKSIDYKNSYQRAKIFESYYLAMFKANRNLCFVLDKNLNIRLFNSSSTKRFNLSQKHLGEKFVSIFPQKVGLKLNEVLKNDKYIGRKEFSFKTSMQINIETRNKIEVIRWKVSRISDERGRPISYVIIGEKELSDNKRHLENTKIGELNGKKDDGGSKELQNKIKQLQIALKRSMEKNRNNDELKIKLKKAKELIKNIESYNKSLKEKLDKKHLNSDGITKIQEELDKKHHELEIMEKVKEELESVRSIDNELVVDELNKRIEKTKSANDKLEKILQQYTSKATWDYIANKIIPQDTEISKTFIVEDYGTMVFGDIQGFTKFAERYDPPKVLESLNQMFNLVTKIVYKFNGDIDKFMGDAFFAYFNSPLNAVKAVTRIAKEVDEVNDERMMSGLTPLFFRFGINYGKVVRGDIGGDLRRENTLIGDAVNVAQRLESSSIPGQILISESTYELIKNDIIVSKEVDLKLKGKKNTVRAYYVESLKEEHLEENED